MSSSRADHSGCARRTSSWWTKYSTVFTSAVDGIDPPRREARRSGADAFDELRPWGLGDSVLDLLGVAGEWLHQHPRSRVGTPLAHHEVGGEVDGPPTLAQRRCIRSELVEEVGQLVPLDGRGRGHANHGTEFTSVPSGVSIGFMRLSYVVGRAKGDAMRTVVSVVTATLIATSAVALSSVTDVGAVSPDVVISQVYGGGGNAGATLTNDFIELYNRGTEPVPLDGWTVQYASAAGTNWATTPLSGILPAGSYYLVQQAQGSGGTTPLPTPDATGTIAMSGTSGKVALVTSSGALSCGSDCDAATGVRDFVGYGAANDSETTATPLLSNTTAAIRSAGGATDTDNNSADFSVGAPNPRSCGAACVPPPPPIPELQISEIHYDNDGADTGEAIEVTGPAGVNLTGWSLVLYNGTGGASYGTIPLSGVLPDEGGTGVGAAAFPGPATGIQNGAPDGVALVEPLGSVVEFLSYEGSFAGVGGPADGAASTDIGVIEDDTTPAGFSLQLLNGAWTGPVASSFGLVNFVPRFCPLATEVTAIHEAQGAGADTPCPGEDITIEGVVVADFEGAAPTLRGFYVQEEDVRRRQRPGHVRGAVRVQRQQQQRQRRRRGAHHWRGSGVPGPDADQLPRRADDPVDREHAADRIDRDAAIRGARLARSGRRACSSRSRRRCTSPSSSSSDGSARCSCRVATACRSRPPTSHPAHPRRRCRRRTT